MTWSHEDEQGGKDDSNYVRVLSIINILSKNIHHVNLQQNIS